MTPGTSLVELADRWGLRLSEERWEGFRLACEAILHAAVAEAEARATENLTHYAVQPFTPVCGADAPNQRTTQINVRATCVPCLWKALGIEAARAREEEREACAKIADTEARPAICATPPPGDSIVDGWIDGARVIASAIRARGRA